jgi:hypothetical protein
MEQQQAEVDHLPSLVIIGRCCVVWAEQLRQQAPELLLAAFNAVVQQQQLQLEEDELTAQAEEQGGVLYYGAVWTPSAATVCLPCKVEGDEDPTLPPCGLEELVAAVSSWVGCVTQPWVQAALAAAAGVDLEQYMQQLEALVAAQQAVRQEGVSDASLAALVQQLQATGVMLSNIPMPHFCNNPACVNIRGPTEVQGAAASVQGAALPATVGGSVSGRPGSSTSQCARQ